LADWTTKRYQLTQVIMNDRLGFDFSSTLIHPGVSLSRRNTSKRGELGFLNELNKPSSAKTHHQALDSRKWSDRIYKSIGVQLSGTNLVVESKMNFAKTLQCYANNLYIDLNQQKFLISYEYLYEKIKSMNLRFACVKVTKDYDLQEENIDSNKEMDSFTLDTEDSNVSDFITHQIEKYLEAAKDFFKKSKNLIRLKTLMKKKRLPDMFKKQLLNSFIAKSFTMSNQKIPLFLIANQIPEEENNEVFKKFRTPESFLRQNSEEDYIENLTNFINEFFEKLVAEILSNKCLDDFESFYSESSDVNTSTSLEVTKGILSTGAIDDFDIRKTSKGSPSFGYLQNSKTREREDFEKIFTTRRTSIKDEGEKKDLEKHFTVSARQNIESLQKTQKLTVSTIYLRLGC